MSLLLMNAFIRRTQQDQTALICAAREARTECVQLLVEAGADLDAIDDVRRIIFYFRVSFFSSLLAAFNFPIYVASKSFSSGFMDADLWLTVARFVGHIQDASTALLIAAQNGHLECVRLLALSGADMEVSEDVRHTLGSFNSPIFSHI